MPNNFFNKSVRSSDIKTEGRTLEDNIRFYSKSFESQLRNAGISKSLISQITDAFANKIVVGRSRYYGELGGIEMGKTLDKMLSKISDKETGKINIEKVNIYLEARQVGIGYIEANSVRGYYSQKLKDGAKLRRKMIRKEEVLPK